MTTPPITWVSANTLIEEQTKNIAREFKSSRPKPRNSAMGFRQEPKKRGKGDAWKAIL